MKLASVLLVALVAAGGAWFGYNKFYSADESASFVTKPVDRGDIIQTVSATGTIDPVVKVIVGSQVSGNIQKWYTDFNAEVKTGTVLAEIEPSRFQSAMKQAEAELATANAREEEAHVRFKDAQRECKRIEGLRLTDNASDNETLVAKATEEAAQATWHAAQASVQSAQAFLDSARVDLARTIIRSPIDGVVISRNIDVGQTVAASLQAPELFVIANDLSRMQVNANVAESDIGLIKEGGQATFRVDAYPKRTFSGRISQLRYNATIVDSVVTYVTVIEAANDDLALRPGMTANITFEVARAANVVRVPNAALRFQLAPPDTTTAMQGRATASTPTVHVMNKDKPGKIELKTGLSDGAFTEVVEGKLKEGDNVITDRSWQGRSPARPDPTRMTRMPGRM